MTLLSSHHCFSFRQPDLPGSLSHLPSLRALWLLLIALYLVVPLPQQLWAFDQLELELGSLSGSGWRAEQVRFNLHWGDPETAYGLHIAKLQLPALQRELSDVELTCNRGAIETRRINCEAGRVSLPDPLFDEAGMAMSFELDRVSGRLSGRLQGIALASGRLDLQFQLDSDGWATGVQGHDLRARRLLAHWPQLQAVLADGGLAGEIELDAQFAGVDDKLRNGKWRGRLAGLSLSDAAGLYAGEGIAIDFSGKLESLAAGWRIDTVLDLGSGELLTPAFYLDAAAHPLKLRGVVALDAALNSLAVQSLELQQPELLSLRLEGALQRSETRPIEWLKLRLDPVAVGDLYREMLQPVLAGTPWGRFEMAGEVDLSLDLQADAMNLDLGLKSFSVDDEGTEASEKRMGVYDLNGRLHWRDEGAVESSRLAWRAGHLLGHIDLGSGAVEFQVSGRSLKLIRQARVPVLDGALVVDRLDLQGLGSESPRLAFDGFIEPISMAALSQALGWLPLSGKLSGMLPGLKYEQGLLSVDGVLLVRIFDGDILIKQLQTRDLFGVYPQLNADIELHNLDLESLTRTFSFGRITGRLDGYVHELRMEDWSPVAFDARFYTPEDDDSRHRISQKAVDNISNLGGAGMSGALARSFMRFFEEFGYKRIGIGCKLSNAVCDMVGAGPAKQGYYLVEGSGIPRIDIIGFNTSADWSSLVEQLKQIAASEGPVVE